MPQKPRAHYGRWLCLSMCVDNLVIADCFDLVQSSAESSLISISLISWGLWGSFLRVNCGASWDENEGQRRIGAYLPSESPQWVIFYVRSPDTRVLLPAGFQLSERLFGGFSGKPREVPSAPSDYRPPDAVPAIQTWCKTDHLCGAAGMYVVGCVWLIAGFKIMFNPVLLEQNKSAGENKT